MAVASLPRCVFCKIVRKELASPIVYEDSEFISFPDYRPAAEHHYLIVTKNHISNIGSLNAGDVELVRKMEAVAKEIMEDRAGHLNDAIFGFHWPITTVSHLHLHAISPASRMSCFKRLEFSRFIFGDVDKAVRALEQTPSAKTE